MSDGLFELRPWAAGTVNADGTTDLIKGAQVVRTGVGDYTLTLDQACGEQDGVILVALGPTAGTPRFIVHDHLSDTQIRVRTMSVAQALFDVDWHFAIWKIR